MKFVVKIFIFFIIMIHLGACIEGPPSADLIGRYHFLQDKTDSIFIKNDHTYEHKFISNGRSIVSSGVWRYQSFGSEITFENFRFYNDEVDNLPPGLWHSKVTVTSDGEIRLMYSSENEVYYLKDK